MAEIAIRVLGTSVRFPVRLTPKGGSDRIDGWASGAEGGLYLKLRVSAPREKGKANKALIALLAKHVGVAKSAIRIINGETARLKVIEITGNTSTLKSRLEALGGNA